jgi:hypothetical protein
VSIKSGQAQLELLIDLKVSFSLADNTYIYFAAKSLFSVFLEGEEGYYHQSLIYLI